MFNCIISWLGFGPTIGRLIYCANAFVELWRLLFSKVPRIDTSRHFTFCIFHIWSSLGETRAPRHTQALSPFFFGIQIYFPCQHVYSFIFFLFYMQSSVSTLLSRTTRLLPTPRIMRMFTISYLMKRHCTLRWLFSFEFTTLTYYYYSLQFNTYNTFILIHILIFYHHQESNHLSNTFNSRVFSRTSHDSSRARLVNCYDSGVSAD